MAKNTNTLKKNAANDSKSSFEDSISPLSKEIIFGVVGYAGAGCSTAIRRLGVFLEDSYKVEIIKLSSLIDSHFPKRTLPTIEDGRRSGSTKFGRAQQLQDWGDEIRSEYGSHAVASLAIKNIRARRGTTQVGEHRVAYLLDSIKHPDEVKLLRQVYGESFHLIAVHCDRAIRESRLIGSSHNPEKKFSGVEPTEVERYLERDESDRAKKHGQQVLDTFYIADYCLDNNDKETNGANMSPDLERFVSLLDSTSLVRPTRAERAMYHAYAASRQSACLSRQVGAAILANDGTIIATGANDVPVFGGGVYEEGDINDSRCHIWEWKDGAVAFTGCHNNRKKTQLRKEIGQWLADSVAERLSEIIHPPQSLQADIAQKARIQAHERIAEFFNGAPEILETMPGIKDLIEYSRSIHAEMNALISAARNGFSPVGSVLFCTTYPCHNCARHLVTAGITEVHYIEPYVKSLATELHEDSIASTRPASGTKPSKMLVLPFTGVGPKMYESFFAKSTELKNRDGSLAKPQQAEPSYAVRLRDLNMVEQTAATLVGDAK